MFSYLTSLFSYKKKYEAAQAEIEAQKAENLRQNRINMKMKRDIVTIVGKLLTISARTEALYDSMTGLTIRVTDKLEDLGLDSDEITDVILGSGDDENEED